GGIRPAALRAHARRAVLAVEPVRAPAAALYRGPRAPRPHVDLHQQRYRLLGPAHALRHPLRDHPHPPGPRRGLNPAAAVGVSSPMRLLLPQAMTAAAMFWAPFALAQQPIGGEQAVTGAAGAIYVDDGGGKDGLPVVFLHSF